MSNPDDTPLRIVHIATIDLTLKVLLMEQLTRLKELGHHVIAVSAPGPYTRDIEATGIRHIAWPHVTRSWAPLSDVRAFFSLVRILKQVRPAVVHTHNPKPGILGRIAARIVGVPCVLNTVHGYYATPEDRYLKRKLILGMERFAARFSHRELFQSEEDLRWAARSCISTSTRRALLGNGTDLTRFHPTRFSHDEIESFRRELGIPKGHFVVGSVGRAVAEKGFVEFAAAARALRQSHRASFVWVGAADPAKSDSVDPTSLDAIGGVKVTGWQPDVERLLAVMDIFVLASWREGVPRSAIEAAAMGKAMVLTDIRGSREVARSREEALFVPPRDAGALTRAIAELMADESLRTALGANAAARARERFDVDTVTEKVVAHTSDLLQDSGLLPIPGAPGMRRARIEDIDRVAELHASGIQEGFLSMLGPRFLRRMYRALIRDPEALVIVVHENEAQIGFVAGVQSAPNFFTSFLRRHAVGAAISILPLLVRPSVLKRLFETARYPHRIPRVADAELLSIVVDPGHARRGLATALVEALLRGLCSRGTSRIQVVAGADNEAANALYHAAGFEPQADIEMHRGSTSRLWSIRCPS